MQLAGKMNPSNSTFSVDCKNKTILSEMEKADLYKGTVVMSFVNPKSNPSKDSPNNDYTDPIDLPTLMTDVDLRENIGN